MSCCNSSTVIPATSARRAEVWENRPLVSHSHSQSREPPSKPSEQQRHSLTLGFRLKLCETTSLERGRQIDRPYGERKHVDAQLNRKYAKVGFGVETRERTVKTPRP